MLTYKEGFTVNSSYQYEDQDITTILRVKLMDYYLNNIDDMPEILACLDNVDYSNQEGQLTIHLRNYEQKSALKKKKILIPCNLGNCHWVGIFLLKDEITGEVIKAEYVDSLKNGSINQNVQEQLRSVYPNVKLKQRKLLVQSDYVSCGAYAINNLFLLSTHHDVEHFDLPDVNDIDIRLEHLKLLDKYKEYLSFAEKQLVNQTRVQSVHAQFKLVNQQNTVHLNEVDTLKVKKIKNYLEQLVDIDIKKSLKSAFCLLHDQESHADHLHRVRMTFINLQKNESCIQATDLNCLKKIKNELFSIKEDESVIFEHTNFCIDYEAILAIVYEKRSYNSLTTGNHISSSSSSSSYDTTIYNEPLKKIAAEQGKQETVLSTFKKPYILSKVKIKNEENEAKEFTFLEYLKKVEKDRNQCSSARLNLSELLIHLKVEEDFLQHLSKCLLEIDLLRSYASIMLEDYQPTVTTTTTTTSIGTAIPAPPPPPLVKPKAKPSTTTSIGTAIPPPPPPPLVKPKAKPSTTTNIGTAIPPPPPLSSPLPGKIIASSSIAKAYIDNSFDDSDIVRYLKALIKRYKISSSHLPLELKKLTSQKKVLEFLDIAKKDLSYIKKVIVTMLVMQDKVLKNIENFLNENKELIIGTDNHSKISAIKLFLYNLYREIYADGKDEYNFSFIGLETYVAKKGDFYPLSYTAESFTSLVELSSEDLNQLIGKKIANLISEIENIKGDAEKGQFNPDKLVFCLKALSTLEQEAFIALQLDEDAKNNFQKLFNENRKLRNDHSLLLCNTSIIALDVLEFFLSLAHKYDIKYINELGVITQDDLEKLFFILIECFSLETSYVEKEVNSEVSTLQIAKSLKGSNLSKLGLTEATQAELPKLLKSQEFMLNADPISVIPMYCFGFIPTKYLSYLYNLKTNKLKTLIVLDENKLKNLFKTQFGKNISEQQLNDLKEEMQKGFYKLRDKKIDSSNFLNFYGDENLNAQITNAKQKAKKIIIEHNERARKEKLHSLVANSNVSIMETSFFAIREQEKYEFFCNNVFALILKLLNAKEGIISTLVNFNTFVANFNGASLTANNLPSIIRGVLPRKKLTSNSKSLIANQTNNSMVAVEYMKKNFAGILFDLLTWLDDEEKLQHGLTELEYTRLKRLNILSSNVDEFNIKKTEYKESFMKRGVLDFNQMPSNVQQILSIQANSLKDLLQINDIFVVNIYDQILTLNQAQELLTNSETINFLKGIMYRDLIIKFKNSQFCSSALLRAMEDEGNLWEYFSNFQELINLRNNLLLIQDGQNNFLLEEIKQKIDVNLLSDDFITMLENIKNLKIEQFQELAEILIQHRNCPSCFKKVLSSTNIQEEHHIFSNIIEDIKKCISIISNLQEVDRQVFINRGISLNNIFSIEEASNTMSSNIFARFIIECFVKDSILEEQIRDSFELIGQLEYLSNLTNEQVIKLNAAITEHTKPIVIGDIKYLGLSKELIERNCVFCSKHNINGEVKYTILTPDDMPVGEDSYYVVSGFKSVLIELPESYFKFLEDFNPKSLLDNFTLIDLAIIVNCLEFENLSMEEQLLITEAKKCIGNNGEGLVVNFINIISREDLRIAIVKSIKTSFIAYIDNFIIKFKLCSGKMVDKKTLIGIIDNDKNNIFNIIRLKINRIFYQQGVLLELSLIIDAARQTIDNAYKVDSRKTLLELLNEEIKADDTELLREYHEHKDGMCKEYEQIKQKLFQEALEISLDRANKEYTNKTLSWDLDNTRDHEVIPVNLISHSRIKLQKGLNNLTLQANILKGIADNNPQCLKLQARLTDLNNKIKDFELGEAQTLVQSCSVYLDANAELFKKIKGKNKEVIQKIQQLFTSDSIDKLMKEVKGESIYLINYENLFESKLNMFVNEYYSFVNGENNKVNNLMVNLLQIDADCNLKFDEIKKFIERVKEEFNLKEEFTQRKCNLRTEELEDKIAEEIVNQSLEANRKTKEFEIARNLLFQAKRDILDKEEQAERAILETEAFRGMPEDIAIIQKEISQIKEEEFKAMHQQQMAFKDELMLLISEEEEVRISFLTEEMDGITGLLTASARKFKELTEQLQKENEEYRDVETGIKDLSSIERLLRTKKINAQTALLHAKNLFMSKQISNYQLMQFKQKMATI